MGELTVGTSRCLPHDMGNAGDLLKHGVLAEFVRWRCESAGSLRFIDLFGGEPWTAPVPEVARRVRALPNCALRAVQSDIGENRYYGSGPVVRRTADALVTRSVRVVAGDGDPDRRTRLQGAGLAMIEEDFPDCDPDASRYDAYDVLGRISSRLTDSDLVLIDPFREFLSRHARSVVPELAKLAKRSAVLLFALNLDPHNRVGRQFDALLEEHLPGAWRLSCPPLPARGVEGESKYQAEVVLAARHLLPCSLREESSAVRAFRERLATYAEHLAGVLDVPAERFGPRVVGAKR